MTFDARGEALKFAETSFLGTAAEWRENLVAFAERLVDAGRAEVMAEPAHPSEHLREELDERGWGFWDLVRAFGGDGIDVLALQLYFACEKAPDLRRRARLGELAGKIGRGLGVSEELFANLERSWLTSVGEVTPTLGDQGEDLTSCGGCGGPAIVWRYDRATTPADPCAWVREPGMWTFDCSGDRS